MKRSKELLKRDYEPIGQIEIDGLDVAKGLERYNGNKRVYTYVLRTYITDVRSLLRTIESVDMKWLTGYSYIINGIKAASYDISAGEIVEMAKYLEAAAKDGNIEYINKNNPSFVKTVRSFIYNLEATLLDIDLIFV